MIKESARDFAKLGWSIKDQLQTAKARTGVAKELTQTLEDQVRKNLDDIA